MKLNIKKILQGLTEKDTEDKPIFKDESFLKACELIRTQREKCNFTRNDLAQRTRISVVVIEAIEKGWIKQFPEKAFLKKMLRTLEINLLLNEDSLIAILKCPNPSREIKPLKSFTPLNIDIFRTWHGNLIYLLLISISLYAINKQQNFLSRIKVLTTEPINYESIPTNQSQKNLKVQLKEEI